MVNGLVGGRIVARGNSVAVAIEKRVLTERGLKLGQRVELVILAPKSASREEKAFEKLFGLFKGAKPLEDYDED